MSSDRTKRINNCWNHFS